MNFSTGATRGSRLCLVSVPVFSICGFLSMQPNIKRASFQDHSAFHKPSAIGKTTYVWLKCNPAAVSGFTLEAPARALKEDTSLAARLVSVPFDTRLGRCLVRALYELLMGENAPQALDYAARGLVARGKS